LANQPVVATRVCQVELTRSRHFIIDNHPDYDNLLIAGGGSAHGFKHGPMTGHYICERLLGRQVDPQPSLRGDSVICDCITRGVGLRTVAPPLGSSPPMSPRGDAYN
jgi:hypothetical protein